MEAIEFTKYYPYKPTYGSTNYSDSSDKGKQLIQTFGSDAEPVRYKPLAQKTNIPNILISLIVHTALRVYSSILTSQDSLIEISSLLEKKVEDMVKHRILRADQNLVNSDHSLPWCASPISSQNKNKKPMKNSNKQNSGFPKAHSTNSKPTKDTAKSSKKSKGNKKKKSSGNMSNDKMDIVKLLLALIS
ncbi:hypothetical protein RclHR1_25200001 [Rhizophagus clarus]|uniref:Uncharacterized protein n=1 Tax=Rhizophagus clarus TaxID=94130 RepID=A0A2Z6RBS8_9GLOM|nr:hypothetical protein RclHR1_25200001 [Rhizophagus clarus]